MTPENRSPLPGEIFEEPYEWLGFAGHHLDSPSQLYSHFPLDFISEAEQSPMQASDHGDVMKDLMKEEEEVASTSESVQAPVEEQTSMVEEVGKRGKKLKGRCNCRHNQCQKDYCECFKRGQLCSSRCGCKKCLRNKFTKRLFCQVEDYSFLNFDHKHNIKNK